MNPYKIYSFYQNKQNITIFYLYDEELKVICGKVMCILLLSLMSNIRIYINAQFK